MPKAWVFCHDRDFYYLKFDNRLARKFYAKKRKVSVLGKPAVVKFGSEILKTM